MSLPLPYRVVPCHAVNSLLNVLFLPYYLLQFCLDAVSAAVSVSDAEGAATVHRLFSILMDVRTQLADSTAVEDAPKAILSHLLRMRRPKEFSIAESDRNRIDLDDLVIDEDTLVLGAALSLGVSSQSRKGGEIEQGWTCRYSSLLRLSLYLSSVPKSLLLPLLGTLMRRGDKWPNILLKSFSHLHTVTSSSSSSSGRVVHKPVEDTGLSAARLVLQVHSPSIPSLSFSSIPFHSLPFSPFPPLSLLSLPFHSISSNPDHSLPFLPFSLFSSIPSFPSPLFHSLPFPSLPTNCGSKVT